MSHRFLFVYRRVPSGKAYKNNSVWKSWFSKGYNGIYPLINYKSVTFNSYVNLPEGKSHFLQLWPLLPELYFVCSFWPPPFRNTFSTERHCCAKMWYNPSNNAISGYIWPVNSSFYVDKKLCYYSINGVVIPRWFHDIKEYHWYSFRSYNPTKITGKGYNWNLKNDLESKNMCVNMFLNSLQNLHRNQECVCNVQVCFVGGRTMVAQVDGPVVQWRWPHLNLKYQPVKKGHMWQWNLEENWLIFPWKRMVIPASNRIW